VWAVVLSGVHNDSRYKKRIIGIQSNYIIEEDVHHTLHTGSCISGTPLVQIFQMYSHRNPSVDLETCSYDYEYDYQLMSCLLHTMIQVTRRESLVSRLQEEDMHFATDLSFL